MSQQLPLTSSSRKAEAEAMFWEVHWSGQHLTKDCRLDACKTLAGADQTQSNPGGRVCDPGRGCLRHHHHRGQACVCSSTKEGPYMCILLLMHQRGSIYIYMYIDMCVLFGDPQERCIGFPFGASNGKTSSRRSSKSSSRWLSRTQRKRIQRGRGGVWSFFRLDHVGATQWRNGWLLDPL